MTSREPTPVPSDVGPLESWSEIRDDEAAIIHCGERWKLIAAKIGCELHGFNDGRSASFITPDGNVIEVGRKFREAIASLASVPQPPTGETDREAWQPIETAPHDCHFVAAYFWDEGGEWVYDIAMWHRDHACGSDEGAGPFTHWRPLPDPPSSASQRG